ncbi:MAG: SH3 domain-containing protein [Sphingomonadales bacterium]|nr:SH3 domain-containing protein [Sphingomonadales bacterium]
MDNLLVGVAGANRPVFQFGDNSAVTAAAIPTGQLALSGPAEKLDAGHWPVRGDLAHIRLAGRCFVPHYAVPMERQVVPAGAKLFALNSKDSDVRAELGGNSLFNVLDIAGDWAWGQVGDDGFVGYVPLAALQERRS